MLPMAMMYYCGDTEGFPLSSVGQRRGLRQRNTWARSTSGSSVGALLPWCFDTLNPDTSRGCVGNLSVLRPPPVHTSSPAVCQCRQLFLSLVGIWLGLPLLLSPTKLTGSTIFLGRQTLGSKMPAYVKELFPYHWWKQTS